VKQNSFKTVLKLFCFQPKQNAVKRLSRFINQSQQVSAVYAKLLKRFTTEAFCLAETKYKTFSILFKNMNI